MTNIVVPALGESVSEATVAGWTKKAGDAVAKNDVLLELETDKVTLEVFAEADGVLAEIAADEGATVGEGAVLGRIDAAAGNGASHGAGQSGPAKAPGKPASGGGDQAQTQAPAAVEATLDVVVPQMGESVAEGTVANWLVKPGQSVKKDDALVELETDKVNIDVPAPADGVVAETLANPGDTVAVGAVIARLSAANGEAMASEPAPAAQAEAPGGGAGTPTLMPAAQRVVSEHGLDPSAISGTGRDGRITKGDALAALANQSAKSALAMTPPAVAPARSEARSDAGPREERVRMSRLRQTIARRLKEAQNSAAMLTTFNEADMSAVMASRAKYKDLFAKKHGIKLGFMSFFVKACVQALQDIPAVNAEIDGDEIVYKNYYDVGIAVGTDKGLVVPVVRDADAKSLGRIERDIADYGRRARDGKLELSELQGATFTITNGGIYGSLMSTPILNAPQSGILGMHKIQDRPMVVDGQVVVRPMMYLALSYDHRIVDGKEAVTFLVRVKECLEDPERLLLDL